MADDKPAVTEEQVKEANAAEEARWQDDFPEEDLNVSYKAEAADDKKPKADEGEEVSDENKEDEDKETGEAEPVTEEYEELEPVVTMQDPGEYKPADYSFTVTLADGKTVTVKTPEDAEKLADDAENFETPKQLLDFIRKSTKMQNQLDKDLEKWENQSKTFKDQLDTETKRRETITTYVGEFNYLVGKGLLPAVAKEYMDADWTDPEVRKQPGVKEQQELLDYMVKENRIRAKARVKPLDSIVDTYNAMQADTSRTKIADAEKAEEDAKKAAGQARKAAGARVAASSPAAQGSYVPKGIAVGNPNVLKRGASVWDN